MIISGAEPLGISCFFHDIILNDLVFFHLKHNDMFDCKFNIEAGLCRKIKAKMTHSTLGPLVG